MSERGSSPVSAQRCKFCGQSVIDPCQDHTDLLIFSATVERCCDASFARLAEIFYESKEPA